MSLDFLFGDEGRMFGYTSVSKAIQAKDSDLFSAVWAMLKPESNRRKEWQEAAKRGGMRLTFHTPLGAPYEESTVDAIARFARIQLARFAPEERGRFGAFRERAQAFMKGLVDEMTAREHDGTKPLTRVSESGNMSPVKSEMALLRARLAGATQGRGKKAELARLMRVTPATISQWLSGSREPGGEATLRLLHWVEQEERRKP